MIFVFLMAEKSTLSRKFPIVSTDVPTALSWTAQAEYISAKGKGTHNFQTFPSMQYTMKKFQKKEKNEDEDDYFDDEEEYIEEEHPINRAYREWNDYEDEILSTSEKSVTEEKSEKKSSTENEKMDVPQKNETSVKNEKGMEVFDLNDL